jgi:hypothetical protein
MTGVLIRDNEIVADEQLSDLPTAIATLARHLESAIGGMSPDGVWVELDCDRTSAHLRFHAYKHKPAT